MNGRVYDTRTGRFISADPIVQAPKDSQSYNRYSYVRNNPLKYTDPSGYSWLSKLGKKLKYHHGPVEGSSSFSPKARHLEVSRGPILSQLEVDMTTNPFCPFSIGDVVRFNPSPRTRGLYQDIERFGLNIGDEAEITFIKDGTYLHFRNGGGWPWNEFELVRKGSS